MELTDRLTRADLYLRVEHRDRTHNEWADALANLNATGFNPARRWHPTAATRIFELTYKLATELYKLDKPKVLKREEYLRSQPEESTQLTDTPRWKRRPGWTR